MSLQREQKIASDECLLEKANSLFLEGRYKEAIEYYQSAGQKLGQHLVETNIWLCKRRLEYTGNGQAFVASPKSSPSTLFDYNKTNLLEQQLRNTQQLLEKYFKEVQELKLTPRIKQ
uniref:tetratricopeptide repeat protein n=1 Tax=Ningiella ruwaisensis TaxID=2364274 RepID=UPI00109FF006|nr:tetratricopeptide repeat protein [Ningiella ruwaisensis]